MIRVIIAIILFEAIPAWGDSQMLSGEVSRVTDGDTLTIVDKYGQQTKIRLYGLDTPESKQAFGSEATAKMKEMVAGREVSVQVMDTDRNRRVVGIIRVAGRDVGRDLAEAGLAWVDPRYCKPSKICRGYWAAARRAQKKKIGM